MNIAILGYGKMGRAIEEQAIARNHKIIVAIDSEKDWDEKYKQFLKADVAIDFSMPETAPKNILKCFEVNIPVVVGTTAWENQFESIKEKCVSEKKSLFYAPNFSIGVNIFFEINKTLADFMDTHKEYDVSLEETHHIQKKDAPSGTAIRIAEQILDRVKRISNWKKGNKKKNNELPVASLRIKKVPGTHIVRYESEIDKIEIKHEAKSRKGFAIGAVLAAEFLQNKSGIFEMKDLLFNNN